MPRTFIVVHAWREEGSSSQITAHTLARQDSHGLIVGRVRGLDASSARGSAPDTACSWTPTTAGARSLLVLRSAAVPAPALGDSCCRPMTVATRSAIRLAETDALSGVACSMAMSSGTHSVEAILRRRFSPGLPATAIQRTERRTCP